MGRKHMEALLTAHYRQNEAKPDEARKEAALQRIAFEAERSCRQNKPLAFGRFIIDQIRFIRKQVWIAQLCLIAFAFLACALGNESSYSTSAVSVVAAATVLVGLPDLLRSQTDRVIELEYACRFDSRSVALARLILLGVSDVVVLTCLIVAVPSFIEIEPLMLFLYASTPYFVVSVGCFFIINHIGKDLALPLCFGFGAAIAIACFAMFDSFPQAYLASSLWVWAVVCVAASIALGIQLKTYLGRIAAGLDRLQPSDLM